MLKDTVTPEQRLNKQNDPLYRALVALGRRHCLHPESTLRYVKSEPSVLNEWRDQRHASKGARRIGRGVRSVRA